ncbi:MAG: GNAT family N-acetyltransferase [Rhodoplanes sp.]
MPSVKAGGDGHGDADRRVLETERLILRAPRPADAPLIAAIVNDRRIAENTARIPHPYRLADAEDWIALANADPRDKTLLITLRDGTIAGACGLEWRDGPHPEIGYWLGVPYWGRGYATEAARALIDQAFGDLGHEAVEAGARTTNPASRRVLEKCGFQWTGVGLCRIRAISSAAPFDRFCLERRIWASLKSWGQTTHRVRHCA